MRPRFLFVIVSTLLLSAPFAVAQNIDMERVEADQEFRRGVQSFNGGYYSDAILSFTRSLSFKPDDPRYRTWLGRAYYFSGYEDAALAEWNAVVEAGSGSVLLDNLIEVTTVRRGIGPEMERLERFVETHVINGRRDGTVVFNQPVSIRPRPDGSVYVTSFGTHDVVLLDANGVVRRRLTGGLAGFDRPFDVLETAEGSLFVSEFGADRISRVRPDGSKVLTFGGRGIEDGRLIGPQYLAADAEGFVYVSDWGNRRVQKFTPDGEFVLSFGRRTPFFDGLQRPTGIAVHGEEVYVAESATGAIYVFDTSGNFLRAIRDVGLDRPESLTAFGDTGLVVSDGLNVKLVDTRFETVAILAALDGGSSRLTSAGVDANGNLVAVDIGANRVVYHSELAEVYTGYSVQIGRVNATAFPRVLVEFSVQTRAGAPIVGIERENVHVTEDGFNVENVELVYRGYGTEPTEIVIVVDRSSGAQNRREEIGRATEEIAQALGGAGRIRVVSAGTAPRLESDPGAPVSSHVQAASTAGAFSRSAAFDSAVRFATNELVRETSRRVVIFVAAAPLSDAAFDRVGLQETMQFLRVNGTVFSVVNVTSGAISPELEYLVAETGGVAADLFDPRGLAPQLGDVFSAPTGRYVVQYDSGRFPDFGRRFMPVELEVVLVRKSGRDEAGYFAPLEF